jgi:transposase-like protein
MSKKQLSKNKPRPYAPEFRRQMVELVRAGRTPEQLAKEFEPSAQAIRNWVAQGDRDEGRRTSAASTFPYFALGTFALQDRLALGLRALTSGPVGRWVLISARTATRLP